MSLDHLNKERIYLTKPDTPTGTRPPQDCQGSQDWVTCGGTVALKQQHGISCGIIALQEQPRISNFTCTLPIAIVMVMDGLDNVTSYETLPTGESTCFLTSTSDS